MRLQDIVLPTKNGVYCALGGFHIDPTRPVDKAVITHGHRDHARAGHGAVLATQETLDIMRLGLGVDFVGSAQAMGYGESVKLGGASVSLHPAGHVLGSAQIAIEANGLRIVASGDYKNFADPTCTPFQRLPCDVFIRHSCGNGRLGNLGHPWAGGCPGTLEHGAGAFRPAVGHCGLRRGGRGR